MLICLLSGNSVLSVAHHKRKQNRPIMTHCTECKINIDNNYADAASIGAANLERIPGNKNKTALFRNMTTPSQAMSNNDRQDVYRSRMEGWRGWLGDKITLDSLMLVVPITDSPIETETSADSAPGVLSETLPQK